MYYCRWNIIEKHYKTPPRNVVKEKEQILELMERAKKLEGKGTKINNSSIGYLVGSIMIFIFGFIGYWIWP